jgi:transcriptional regulator with XRE-family HTH domain
MSTRREREITERVMEARQAAGLSRREVGDALSLGEQSYGHYERGRYAFTVDQIFALSRVLGRSVEWLLGLDTSHSAEEDELLTRFRRIRSQAIREVVLKSVRDQEALDQRLREDN